MKVEKVIEPLASIAAMLTKFPDESILCVPAPPPVLIPVVALRVVPVIVFEVEMVPNPDAIDPLANAPTVVREEVRTPVPRVVALSTEVALIKNSLPLERLMSPVERTVPLPFDGDSVMSPVVSPPRVRVWRAVV